MIYAGICDLLADAILMQIYFLHQNLFAFNLNILGPHLNFELTIVVTD